MPEGATLLAMTLARTSHRAPAQHFALSGWVYRRRHLVERLFNRIKHFKGIAKCYDKLPENYRAAVKPARVLDRNKLDNLQD